VLPERNQKVFNTVLDNGTTCKHSQKVVHSNIIHSGLELGMRFPEGFDHIQIRGAKRVPLVGETPAPQEPPVDKEEQPPQKKQKRFENVPRGYRLKRKAEQDTSVGTKPPKPNLPLAKTTTPTAQTGFATLTSTNIFGLSSRSELFYPEAYKPISRVYWAQITNAERLDLIRQQAEIVKKVGYREQPLVVPDARTHADMAYDEAVSRRLVYMRHRLKRRKQGVSKDRQEEERRKLPLVRRYVERELRLVEPTQFIQAGALDTPILVPGIGIIKQGVRPPAKRIRRRRRRPDKQQKNQTTPSPPPQLPKFETRGAPEIEMEKLRRGYGLKSRSEQDYPEAYRRMSSIFWRALTDNQREQIMRVQAAAMEKVGFERGTDKRYIQDFDPLQENIYAVQSHEPDEPPSASSALNLPLGIALTVGGALMLLAVFARAVPFSVALAGGFTILIGAALSLPWRR